MELLELFFCFFQIGLFSIGGGYAAIPLIEAQVVDANGWLSVAEFTDLVTIAEMTPGPIAVNSATFVGIRLAGVPGAIVATLGCIAPSLILVALLAVLYSKFRKLDVMQNLLSTTRPVVVALIASAAVTLVLQAFFGGTVAGLDPIAVVLFAAALLFLRLLKPSPILVMLACGVIGGGLYYITG
ncbi:MAG: chromate transporter [Clostridia bacterium]|nr:chromate transporter [Clostridia bacterium]